MDPMMMGMDPMMMGGMDPMMMVAWTLHDGKMDPAWGGGMMMEIQ